MAESRYFRKKLHWMLDKVLNTPKFVDRLILPIYICLKVRKKYCELTVLTSSNWVFFEQATF